MTLKSFNLTQDLTNQPRSIHEIVGITGSLFSNSSNVKHFNNIFSGTMS
ncbi:unnamed protein product, partial [marine sediment metagenome]